MTLCAFLSFSLTKNHHHPPTNKHPTNSPQPSALCLFPRLPFAAPVSSGPCFHQLLQPVFPTARPSSSAVLPAQSAPATTPSAWSTPPANHSPSTALRSPGGPFSFTGASQHSRGCSPETPLGDRSIPVLIHHTAASSLAFNRVSIQHPSGLSRVLATSKYLQRHRLHTVYHYATTPNLQGIRSAQPPRHICYID
ncbi:hypothetical protein BO70DRAFT_79325 [Aspergillus heteromorphus CBS 117.55]|uniref:Uncharacterized protein n=1 Tax=Aspergillus heteromorphus CBS 117.55 TaxID=1448321 RepID=A0A317WZS4_9EURO|nr:uncharacterized protein BO70DRAFT_79325 [Aspergillus heteromorphus CBS 117.55]PWY90822.1 hypothetical protein BO70DRAFT_79325 [Aspergillus heteromorphus CBS 117.55]